MGRHAGFIIMCCVCRKVRSKTGKWYKRRQLSSESIISHTYCPVCSAKIISEMNKEKAVS
jgi:hypothetical protein